MREYCWKSMGFSADAQAVGQELEKIEILGELSSEAVLNYAEKNPDSEVYKCFEWDDDEASRKYRLYQANQILCSISIKIKEKPTEKQRIYVNVKSSETHAKTFKNIKEVLKNDEEYQQLVNKAKDDFIRCKDKYDKIIERDDLKDVIFAIYREI